MYYFVAAVFGLAWCLAPIIALVVAFRARRDLVEIRDRLDSLEAGVPATRGRPRGVRICAGRRLDDAPRRSDGDAHSRHHERGVDAAGRGAHGSWVGTRLGLRPLDGTWARRTNAVEVRSVRPTTGGCLLAVRSRARCWSCSAPALVRVSAQESQREGGVREYRKGHDSDSKGGTTEWQGRRELLEPAAVDNLAPASQRLVNARALSASWPRRRSPGRPKSTPYSYSDRHHRPP
jgi:hypothetical protein